MSIHCPEDASLNIMSLIPANILNWVAVCLGTIQVEKQKRLKNGKIVLLVRGLERMSLLFTTFDLRRRTRTDYTLIVTLCQTKMKILKKYL